MWAEQEFEAKLRTRLATLPDPLGSELLGDYLSARRFVVDEIAGHIGSVEPDITDHSASHLADVMSRANSLVDDDYFSPLEMYLLCVSILFHDVGNLHGRADHQKKIADIYNACRHQHARFNAERQAVLTIAGAHTGSTKDGSKDTLQEVHPFPFKGLTVRGQELAAVLRLADELAEGPHRTSAYFLNHGGYDAKSIIFHRYASAAEYSIDGARIALSFTINMKCAEGGPEIAEGLSLQDFLSFCYKRIAKVDAERRYCRHYSPLLTKLRETSAWFSFWVDGRQLDTDLEKLVLSDLMIPGENTKEIVKHNPRYDPALLAERFKAECDGNGL